jgi:pimeloyl-ACP methyl ester carboxylesterase
VTRQRIALSTGVTLDIFVAGDPAHPALIFLHGFPENHRTWRHQLAHLADRYYCIAPDQRGYGGSSKPAAVADYSADKLTADIFALADALGVERFTIVGHDWGGAIAWSVALNGQAGAPDPAWAGRVTRAVIANAPHPFLFQRLLVEDAEQRAASQYIRAFRDTAFDAEIRAHGLEPFLARVTRWQHSEAMEPDERAALLAEWADGHRAIAMLNWYRATPLHVPAMDEDVSVPPVAADAFPKLMIPALVIWAMDDKALPPSNLDGIEALVPNAQIERIAGCGHFVTWEAPDAVNAALDAWLKATGDAQS